jgi:hypothetical protein
LPIRNNRQLRLIQSSPSTALTGVLGVDAPYFPYLLTMNFCRAPLQMVIITTRIIRMTEPIFAFLSIQK